MRRIAEQCAEDIARIVRDGGKTADGGRAQSAAPARAGAVEAPDDIIAFGRLCRERGWSDGLPLVPSTVERVEAMLAATPRARDEVVALVAPAFGAATVERIAANAVMAGCEPACLPVLIAAVEALGDKAFNLQGIQATTNPATPWLIVNGPVANAIGINGGLNCLGPGSPANATIGRALRLILQNIGGGRAGEMDRATQGQPGKYAFCCAENEAESPWEALHVERGFAPDSSTVTVVGASGTLNLNSHAKDAESLLAAFADSITYPLSNDYFFGGEPWLIISPEHAEVLKRGGFAKADVKRRLWEDARLEARRLPPKDLARVVHIRRAELGEIGPDTRLPVAPGPEQIGIVVAGGPGTHSVYVPSFGVTRGITRPIATR